MASTKTKGRVYTQAELDKILGDYQVKCQMVYHEGTVPSAGEWFYGEYSKGTGGISELSPPIYAHTITHPSVINERLVEAVKNRIRYNIDVEYRNDGIREAAIATDGNIAFVEALEEKMKDAGENAVKEKKGLENIMNLPPAFYVANQLLHLDPHELLLYLRAMNLSSMLMNQIVNAYNDIKNGSTYRSDFFKTL